MTSCTHFGTVTINPHVIFSGFSDQIGTRITARPRGRSEADITGFWNMSVHSVYPWLVPRYIRKDSFQIFFQYVKWGFRDQEQKVHNFRELRQKAGVENFHEV